MDRGRQYNYRCGHTARGCRDAVRYVSDGSGVRPHCQHSCCYFGEDHGFVIAEEMASSADRDAPVQLIHVACCAGELGVIPIALVVIATLVPIIVFVFASSRGAGLSCGFGDTPICRFRRR